MTPPSPSPSRTPREWRVRKLVREGDYWPRGYGLAWFDMQYRRAVCYPMPLNWLLRGARAFLFWCREPHVWSKYEDDAWTAYEHGNRHGYRDGYDAGVRHSVTAFNAAKENA